ncbi:MAG: hypothetical protein KJ941_04305 [Bacteroidetes bacterium]|nr:hypothetical protein [Bacteroidota bacterium]
MAGFHVHVYMLNEHFSQEHADANHNGQESENNKLLDWEDEMVLRGEVKFQHEEAKSTYVIRGEKNNRSFEIPLPMMRIFSFEENNVLSAQIACSESLYHSHEMTDSKLELTLKGEPYANPIPGIYIASNEFPKELIVSD